MKWISRYRIVMCVLLVTMIAGCPYERIVSLNTDPEGAKVVATSELGLKYYPDKLTPLDYRFKFGENPSEGPSKYNVEFRLEGYEPQTVTIVGKDYNQKRIYVTLQREMVREVERLEPVISEETGYTIEPRTVRAWAEDIEREVMAASHIVSLGDFQSILGMSISADGNKLVFSLAERVKDERGNEKTVANLRSIQTKGGGITEITSGQWLDTSPALGPDDYLFFSSNRLRKRSMDIFRISSEKASAIAVVRQTSEGINYQPSVSNNGVITFTYEPTYRERYTGSRQIWSLGGENQYPTQLREGEMPAISPDGTQIAYIGPDKQLWKVPINGQNPVQLTSTPIQIEGKRYPAWSPDGKYILYASDEGKDSKNEANYDIWMVHEDGTNTRQLTTNGSLDDFPVVSLDQQYIYFVSNRGFKEGIWRIPFPASD
jgi:Tol biopolymer transport system component